jgi:hypothetical protein
MSTPTFELEGKPNSLTAPIALAEPVEDPQSSPKQDPRIEYVVLQKSDNKLESEDSLMSHKSKRIVRILAALLGAVATVIGVFVTMIYQIKIYSAEVEFKEKLVN